MDTRPRERDVTNVYSAEFAGLCLVNAQVVACSTLQWQAANSYCAQLGILLFGERLQMGNN